MKKIAKKTIVTGVICAVLSTSSGILPAQSYAAGKIGLSKSSITIKACETKKIQLKNVSKKKYSKIKWSVTNKKIAAIRKNKKNNSVVSITGQSEGKAKVKAKYSGKTYTCNVKVESENCGSKAVNPTPKIIYVEKTGVPAPTPQIIYVTVTPKPEMTPSVTSSQGNLTYQSDVKADMTSASYWADKCSEPDKVLATQEQIQKINREIIEKKETNMNDIMNISDTYNASNRKNNLADAFVNDVQKGRVGDRDVYLDGVLVEDKEAFFAAIKKNIEDAVTEDNAKVRYALCTKAAELKMAPVEGFVGWSAKDTDEEFMDSRLNVNEPFVVEAVTADGKFYWGRTTNCSGWALADHFAICDNKEEWASMWNGSGEDILVVTQDKITLAPSAYDKALDKLELQFGTVLPLVPKKDIKETVDDRGTWYNYVVYFPTRDSNGRFVRSTALIGMNNKVNVGYVPLTKRNILNVAFNCIGNRYGWGGMMDLMDCSLYTRDIYKCFGYELPRNTTWQVSIPSDYVTKLSDMNDDEKKKKIDTLEPGTLLMFKGHITMYIGSEGGKQYVISDLGSAAETAACDESGTVKSIFTVAVNSLDIRRRNGNTWLTDMSYAVRPWRL